MSFVKLASGLFSVDARSKSTWPLSKSVTMIPEAENRLGMEIAPPTERARSGEGAAMERLLSVGRSGMDRPSTGSIPISRTDRTEGIIASSVGMNPSLGRVRDDFTVKKIGVGQGVVESVFDVMQRILFVF